MRRTIAAIFVAFAVAVAAVSVVLLNEGLGQYSIRFMTAALVFSAIAAWLEISKRRGSFAWKLNAKLACFVLRRHPRQSNAGYRFCRHCNSIYQPKGWEDRDGRSL